jgi:SnoaL-like domain
LGAMLRARRRIRVRRPCRAWLRGAARIRRGAHARAAGAAQTLNHLYDVDGDRATGRATTVVSIATPSGYKIMGQGVYHDDLVKADEWKIRNRRVVNDHVVSDPAKPVNLADPDVAAQVRQLINTTVDLARHGS